MASLISAMERSMASSSSSSSALSGRPLVGWMVEAKALSSMEAVSVKPGRPRRWRALAGASHSKDRESGGVGKSVGPSV